MDRPTKVIRARNRTEENQTTFTYDDIGHTITTTGDLNVDIDGGLVAKIICDGLGRTTETRQYEGGSKYIATQQQYDAMGRGYKTSNPFRPLPPDNETPVWTTAGFDALSRSISVTTPDSAVVGTAFSGNQVLVTDQFGRQRISKTNALGQLKDVWEVTSPDPATEGISFPGHIEVTAGYHTSYAYDVLDDLTTVTQGVQTRSFAYDSLKRLTSATNPESGTINYIYDNNGNLLVKTDARSVSSHWSYDALNRVARRWYNSSSSLTATVNNNPALPAAVGATAEVNYIYDAQSLPSGAPGFDRGYATGRLVAVTYGSGSSAGTYRGYDAMGRVLRQYQQTDAVNYLVEASYYANSAIHNETYPSIPGYGDRRVVSHVNDAAGRLGSLSSDATTYAPGASVSAVGYASHNAVNTETYGNNLIRAVGFNNRLQSTEIKLGTSGAPTSVVDLIFNYGGTNNNGNVQSLSYNGGGLSYTQTFGYDPLNRLTTSVEGGASWSQTNSYDRYGNRSIVGGGPSFDANNNRIVGYSYDAAGDLFNDGYHAYTYDAENKISKVDGNSAYVYDGEGQRVRKLLSENLRFIYDMGGKQIAEFDGVNGTLKKEYIYGASGLAATIEPASVNSNGTRYSTEDNLGTPRVITNSSAGVVSRHDYKPFGEELGSGIGGRTPGMGYGVADGVRQKFTLKERDIETGLDYFTNRYYSAVQGRFTSVDPENAGADSSDPQSWNGYAYVGNAPLTNTDPLGLWKQVDCTSGEGKCWESDNKNDTISSLAKILNVNAKDLNTFFQKPTVHMGDSFDVSGFGLNNNTTIRANVVQVFLVSEPERSRTEVAMAGVAVAVRADPEPISKIGGALAIAAYLLKDKIANTLLDKTPVTHPDDFEHVRGTPAKRNKKTGEIWERDRLHKNHWEVYRNKKDYDNGKRDRAVWDDGREKEKF